MAFPARSLSTTTAPQRSGRALRAYGVLLGVLLAGYLFFDRAFAYLHLPGTPLYVGELVLVIGVLGVCCATGSLRIPLRNEPVLALLAAFVIWGAVRSVPGVVSYGVEAIRDAAIWYYCSFAFLTLATLTRHPDLLERWLGGLARIVPLLVVWLPICVVLSPFADKAPTVPFTTTSILSHKAGSVVIAVLLVLGSMWLLRDVRSERSRSGWSLVALLTVTLVATQNRGGLLAFAAGAIVALAFVPDRSRLTLRTVAVVTVGLTLALLLPFKIPVAGLQGREFSAEQLVANVTSLTGRETPGNLGGTVEGRQELWSRILDKQIWDGRLAEGSGFGQNLAAEVHVYDDGKETLRSPHNSHLHVMARLGVVGLALWIALWVAWYWRLVAGCRRLAREGLHRRRQVAGVCLTVTTATLVSSTFDPQFEGPQVAVLIWTLFGVGVAVTSKRGWFRTG
jgi:hypothetical protein